MCAPAGGWCTLPEIGLSHIEARLGPEGASRSVPGLLRPKSGTELSEQVPVQI